MPPTEAEENPPDELIGQTLGDYEIIRLVGRGGMGVVYEAKQLSNNRIVALKIPHDYLAGEDGYLRRFYHEARIAARVKHRNIVAPFDIGNSGPYHYIAMELVRGRPLSVAIKNGEIGLVSGLEIARQIAEALAEVHRHEIIHRDIKPDNILLEFTGAPKMTDFGIARVIDVGSARARRRPQERSPRDWAGTPSYSSPEQCLGIRSDHRTDIYSLGVVLFEMMTGKAPFKSSVQSELLRMILNVPVPLASKHNPRVPGSIQAIIERAMAKKPDDRYNTASEMAEDIVAALTDMGSWTPGPQPPPRIDAIQPIMRMGEFDVVRVVASNKTGRVYEAKAEGQHRSVVLRTPPDYLASEEGFLRRFRREAAAAIEVRHPNVVQVYEMGEEKGIPFLVTELVWGRTLAETMRKATKMSIPQVVEIAREMAAGLAGMHAQGLCHSRLRPNNVMIDDTGHPKIMDLGVARPRRRDRDGEGTDLGQVDHLFYQPPESCLQLRTDHRSDLYSLGVMLFEMLAGRVPFMIKSKWELLQMIVDSPAPPIAKYNPRCSAPLQAIVERGLAKKPEQRFQSAEELGEALDGVLAEFSEIKHLPDPARPKP